MATYMEYAIDDENILRVETDEMDDGIVQVARDQQDVIVKTSVDFRKALHGAKVSTQALVSEFREMSIDEMEITFGLKSSGEAGLFAIGKIGMEANYQVKLKWKRQEE